VLLGVLAGWAPWFPLVGRTKFYYYALEFEPFLILSLTLCLGLILGPATASALRRSVSTGAAPSFAALSAAFDVTAPSVSGRVLVTTLAHVLGHRDNVTAAYARGVRRLAEVAAGAAASAGMAEPEATLAAATFVSSMLGYGLQRALDPELGPRAGAVIGQAFDHCGGGA